MPKVTLAQFPLGERMTIPPDKGKDRTYTTFIARCRRCSFVNVLNNFKESELRVTNCRFCGYTPE